MLVEPADQPGAGLAVSTLCVPPGRCGRSGYDIKLIWGDSVRYRVVQWATRNIGRRSLRASLDHPDLEVVGVRVFGPDKVGVDAGELAGPVRTGVTATDDVDALVALDADCVLHMPSRLDVDELCRLLASGKNVVSTCAELVHVRRALPADVADRLEAACQEGGVSLFALGAARLHQRRRPDRAAVPGALLDTLLIEEFADLSQRDSPKLLFEVMGMGRRPGRGRRRRAEHMRSSFGPPLEALAERIGVAIDRVEAKTEVAVASRRVTIAAGDIEAGGIAAQRTTVDALAGDDARLSSAPPGTAPTRSTPTGRSAPPAGG